MSLRAYRQPFSHSFAIGKRGIGCSLQAQGYLEGLVAISVHRVINGHASADHDYLLSGLLIAEMSVDLD